MNPLVIEGKVLLVGDKFYYDFESDSQFPNDPKGWVRCSFSGLAGRNSIVAKPQGFQKFIIGTNKLERFRLQAPEG